MGFFDALFSKTAEELHSIGADLLNNVKSRVGEMAPPLPSDSGFQPKMPTFLEGSALSSGIHKSFGLVQEDLPDLVMDFIPGVHNRPVYMGGTEQDPRTTVVNQRTLDVGPWSWDLGARTSYLPPAPPAPEIHSNNTDMMWKLGAIPYQEVNFQRFGDVDNKVNDYLRGPNHNVYVPKSEDPNQEWAT